jgi:hypothetical protein
MEQAYTTSQVIHLLIVSLRFLTSIGEGRAIHFTSIEAANGNAKSQDA